ncbi:hypothetical protein JCM3765_006327 [Sporobolomyces pararoseus]
MTPKPLDANEQAHILIARFLSHQNYSATLSAFLSESTSKNPQLRFTSQTAERDRDGQDWNDLVEDWIARKISQVKLQDQDSQLEEELKSLESSNILDQQRIPNRVKTVIKEATNVLNVKQGVLPRKEWDSIKLEFKESSTSCIITTTVDRTLKIWSYPTRSSCSRNPLELLESHSFPSPVLSFVQHPQSEFKRFIACATMEGSLHLLDLVTRDKLVKIKDHNKYIVKVVWSPDGRHLATIGYDKLIHVYSTTITSPESDTDSPTISISLVHTLHPRTNPEAAVFLPDSTHLVWTARDDHLLHYLSLPSSPSSGSTSTTPPWEMTEYNLNPNLDSFTSFSILSLNVHPTLPLLSLQTSTTSSRIFLYPFHSSTRLKTIHTSSQQSDYFNPRHCCKNFGVVVNSEDGFVRFWSLGGGRDGGGVEVVKKGCHGIAAPLEDDEEDEEEESKRDVETEELKSERARARRERERGSSVVRDVEIIYLEDEEGGWAILSAGFDKTVRMII